MKANCLTIFDHMECLQDQNNKIFSLYSCLCWHQHGSAPLSHFPAAYWIMSVCRLFNWLGCYYFVCIHSQKSIGTFSDLIMCFAFIRLCLTLMCYNDLYLLWGRGIQREYITIYLNKLTLRWQKVLYIRWYMSSQFDFCGLQHHEACQQYEFLPLTLVIHPYQLSHEVSPGVNRKLMNVSS